MNATKIFVEALSRKSIKVTALFMLLAMFICGCSEINKEEISGANQNKQQEYSQTPKSAENVQQFTGAISFRNVGWGMTMEQVKKMESAEFVDEGEDLLLYEDTVLNIPVTLYYNFENNKLTGAGYQPKDKTNPNKCIEEYEEIQNAYINKYGKETSEVVGGDKKDQEDSKNWGELLQKGKISFVTTWDLKDTVIELYLHQMPPNGIGFYISYESKNLAHGKSKL